MNWREQKEKTPYPQVKKAVFWETAVYLFIGWINLESQKCGCVPQTLALSLLLVLLPSHSFQYS